MTHCVTCRRQLPVYLIDRSGNCASCRLTLQRQRTDAVITQAQATLDHSQHLIRQLSDLVSPPEVETDQIRVERADQRHEEPR